MKKLPLLIPHIFLLISSLVFGQESYRLLFDDYQLKIVAPKEYRLLKQPDATTEYMLVKINPAVAISFNEEETLKITDDNLVPLLKSRQMRVKAEEKIYSFMPDYEVIDYEVKIFFDNVYSVKISCFGNGESLGIDETVVYVGYLTPYKNKTLHFEALLMGDKSAIQNREKLVNEISEIISSIKFESHPPKNHSL